MIRFLTTDLGQLAVERLDFEVLLSRSLTSITGPTMPARWWRLSWGEKNTRNTRLGVAAGFGAYWAMASKNLIEETRQECAGKPQAQKVYEELGYFVHNIDRMQHRTFRRQGLFIGSGVIEAGCKSVIGSRCKQSGMFWGKPGAENILA